MKPGRMKAYVEFVVTCTQCPNVDTFKAVTPFIEDVRVKAELAANYFDELGWTQLPSGGWLCGRSHEHKREAAA